jgi:hypothetical protein
MYAQQDLMDKFGEQTKHFIMTNINDYKKLKDRVSHIYKTYTTLFRINRRRLALMTLWARPISLRPKTQRKRARGRKQIKQRRHFRVHFVNSEHLGEALKQRINLQEQVSPAEYCKITKENVHLLQALVVTLTPLTSLIRFKASLH